MTSGPFISEAPIMKKITSCLATTSVVVATFAVTCVVPATGAPLHLPMMQIAHPSAITEVNWRGGGWHGGGGGWHGGGWRGGGGGWHGGGWRGGGGGWHGGGWYGGGGWYPSGYYGGWYPGYGGYYGDGLWIGGGALLLGALVGSAIANNAYHGGHYYYEDPHPRRYYRHPDYSHRYSYGAYVTRHADPYLGWQRALDH